MKTQKEMKQIAKILNQKENDGWKVTRMWGDKEWWLVSECGEALHWSDLGEYDKMIEQSIGTGKRR